MSPIESPTPRVGLPPHPRVLIIGDSWIRGLGMERRVAFGRAVARSYEPERILDLSAISRTAVDLVTDHLDAIGAFAPHLALVNVGGADSLMFPPAFIQRLIDRYAPPAWHGMHGLMPLARYSTSRRERMRQRVDHWAKVVIKQVVMNLLGARRRVQVAEFEQAMAAIMQTLQALGTYVVVLGFGPVDGLTSPKTNASVARTEAVLRRLADETPRAIYIATSGFVRRWGDYLDDHVHLNAEGHERVATGVLATLAAAGSPWRPAPAETTEAALPAVGGAL